ncbi:MAG: cytochrome P450 [Alphaproteobacteria bacterium]|nr:cytochrome P450 [Alphaproteobacteria bacterium]
MHPPTDPIAAVTHPDPYPYYAALVAERPFLRDERLGLWVAAGAAAVEGALSAGAARVRPPDQPVPPALLGSAVGGTFGRLVRMTDGAYHAAMRQAVVATLAAVDAARIRDAATHAAAILRLDRSARPFVDRVEAAMAGLPVATVALLLGVRPEDVAAMVGGAGDVVRAIAPAATADEVGRGADAIAVLRGLLTAAAADAPFALLVSEARKAGCDAEAAVANAVGFLSQTFDATAGLVGNALRALARERPERSGVPSDPVRTAAFLREVLRHDPPVHNTRRFLAAEAVVAGRPLPAGSQILVVLAAAGRDPAINPSPGRFAIDRPDRRHFAFGAGRHACPGETIATGVAAFALCLLASGIGDLPVDPAYRALPNARIPVFRR